MNIQQLIEEIERLEKELKIADERWKRAERHHREKHETEMEVCTHERLYGVNCPLKNPDCLKHIRENSGRGSICMVAGESVG